jgi:hypothetical protein
MSFEQADKLCDEIMDFLISCGGPYTGVHGIIQAHIMDTLRSGQYVLERNADGIRWYACWWKVFPEDLQPMMCGNVPSSTDDGPILFVLQCGNKDGLSGMLALRRALKRTAKTWQGVVWERNNRELKAFPGNHGEN